MKNTVKKIWVSVKAHKIITGVIVVVVLFGGYYIYKKVIVGTAPTQYVLAAVTRGTLISAVSGTGQVAAKNQVDVLPQGSGTITDVRVVQGDKVTEGQTLAILDQKNALVSLNQAKASVESAQANYDKVLKGATSQSLNVGQISVQGAEQSLSNAISSAYTQTDNLIRTDIDTFFLNPTTFSPQFGIRFFDSSSNAAITLEPTDQNLTMNLGYKRAHMTDVLKGLRDIVSATSSLDISAKGDATISSLTEVRSFLNDISDAVNSIYLNQTKYQSNLDSFKSTAASARTSVDSLITSIRNAQQSLASSKASFAVTSAPATAEEIASAKSQVDNAQASLQSAQNNYSNNVIKAPFAGLVAAINIHKGDVAGGSTVIATITTDQKIAEISLNEVDVAKITLGNKATLTFDAVPDLSISGTVAEIAAIGTVTQGVVTYEVKIAFDTQDERIKPGMSVTSDIITVSKPDVLMIASTAVKTDNQGMSYVQELTDSSAGAGTIATKTAPKNVPVGTGISNDSDTEIVSGLNEGDRVIIRTISSASAATVSSAPSLFGGGSTRAVGGAAGGGANRGR